MGKAEVLSLLRDGEYVSGEEISRALGVTRAAVWKAVQALRADGCSIDSVPNRGYCLHRPESALSDAAVHALLEGCPWPINVLPTVDSTNTYAKAQAALGAPHGSVYITGRQTGGRGRRGRTFVSPPGGVYLSVLLRPQREAAELLWLTAAVAVAIRRAIRDCCPADVGIKWTNDRQAEGLRHPDGAGGRGRQRHAGICRGRHRRELQHGHGCPARACA